MTCHLQHQRPPPPIESCWTGLNWFKRLNWVWQIKWSSHTQKPKSKFSGLRIHTSYRKISTTSKHFDAKKKTEQRSLLQMDLNPYPRLTLSTISKMGQKQKFSFFFLALLQLKKSKKYFYSCQWSHKLTLRFDRNSTFIILRDAFWRQM